jgi:hypothetical protein
VHHQRRARPRRTRGGPAEGPAIQIDEVDLARRLAQPLQIEIVGVARAQHAQAPAPRLAQHGFDHLGQTLTVPGVEVPVTGGLRVVAGLAGDGGAQARSLHVQRRWKTIA